MSDGREKFRLNIVGADEDVPRLLLAYGRGCGGEVALVMRPRDGQAALVHQVKKQPAKVWSSDRSLAPCLLVVRLVGAGADPQGLALWARLDDGQVHEVGSGDELLDLAEAAAGLPARPRGSRGGGS